KTNRDREKRIPGSDIILDGRRSGAEASSLPAVFQSRTRALSTGRPAARSRGRAKATEIGFTPLAATLSRPLSDSDHRLILWNSPSTGYECPNRPTGRQLNRTHEGPQSDDESHTDRWRKFLGVGSETAAVA